MEPEEEEKSNLTGYPGTERLAKVGTITYRPEDRGLASCWASRKRQTSPRLGMPLMGQQRMSHNL